MSSLLLSKILIVTVELCPFIYKSPAVSQIFAQALELSPNKFCASRAILPEYSNMSSATLLFMLERLIALDHPQPGDYGILIGFGAGLTLEFVLLQW